MSPDFGVSALVRANLEHLFEATAGLGRVWIYGSRARGDHRPGSDIDLAVEVESAQAFRNLWSAVERAELFYGIDLIDLGRLSDSRLRDHIDREKKLFWERKVDVAADRGHGAARLHLR